MRNIATLLSVLLLAHSVHAGVQYRETFPAGTDAASMGWKLFIDDKCWDSSTGVHIFGDAPGQGALPAVNSKPSAIDAAWKGFVFIPQGSPFLFFTEEFKVESKINAISFYLGTGESDDAAHVAVRVDANSNGIDETDPWFISQQGLTVPLEHRKKDIRESGLTRFEFAGAKWKKLVVQTPVSADGGKLAAGEDAAALPAGPVVAFGVFMPKRSATPTFDSFTIETDQPDAPPAPVERPKPAAFFGPVEPVALAPVTLPDEKHPAFGQVVLNGGGYFTGFFPSRAAPGSAYAISDMTGPWFRNSPKDAWHLMRLTSTFDPPLSRADRPAHGISGIALHPTDANIILADMGMGRIFDTPSGLYRSTDAGKTFVRVLDVYSASNLDHTENTGSRLWGSSVVIDPQNPDLVLYGTRREGVFLSRDGGLTFKKALDPQASVRSVQIAGDFLFAFALGKGMFVAHRSDEQFSPDAAFNALLGSLKQVQTIKSSDDGRVYVAHGDRLAARDASGWRDITPAIGRGLIESVAVDAKNGNRVVATRSEPGYGNPKYLLRSLDGGKTWESVPWKMTGMEGWQKVNGWQFNMAVADITIDPTDSNVAYVSDVYNIWQTDDIWATPVEWRSQNRGAENVVGLELKTIRARADAVEPATLISGVSDIRGFVHRDIHRMPQDSYIMADRDWSIYVTGADVVENDPNVIYVAKTFGLHPEGLHTLVLRSTDNGKSWQMIGRPSGEVQDAGGKIAVSATDKGKVFFVPGNSKSPMYSHDGGHSWHVAMLDTGLNSGQPLPPIYSRNTGYNFAQAQASDKVDGNTFYAFASTFERPGATTAEFFVSRDGAKTWTRSNSSLPDSNPFNSISPLVIEPVYGSAGELYISLSGGGIWHSNDFGQTFSPLTAFENEQPMLVAVGAPDPRHADAAASVYVYARAKGAAHWAIHRSTDGGKTWTAASKEAGDYTQVSPMIFAADRNTFGRVYLGTPGIGLWYVDTAR
jgi:xyloglucan-specific exo-beta-1,4-glucanase